MWLAAEDTAGTSPELVIAIFTLAGVVVTAIGGVVIALINSRSKSTSATAPTPAPVLAGGGELHSSERLAVVERRLDDSDERDEIQDRRIDQIERTLDLDNRWWQGRPR